MYDPQHKDPYFISCTKCEQVSYIHFLDYDIDRTVEENCPVCKNKDREARDRLEQREKRKEKLDGDFRY